MLYNSIYMPEQSGETHKITRRDLLTSWNQKSPSGSIAIKKTEPLRLTTDSMIEHKPSLTRQQFLQVILAAGASLAAEHYLGIKPVAAKKEDRQSSVQSEGTLPQARVQLVEQTKTNNPPNLLPVEKEPTFIDTEVETALLTMAELISVPVLKALKIPVGNASIDQKTLTKFLNWPLYKTIFVAGVGVPVLEEVLFRGLPNFIVRGQPKENLWGIGIPVSAVFALCHNVRTDENTGKTAFATDKIPLYQFVNGLFFWKMMRERGFPHAVAAHGTINSVALTIGRLLYEAFPEKSYAGVSRDVVSRER